MASFQISPGVQVKEQDLSLIIPAVPVSIGALAGDFSWGPVDEITLVDSVEKLRRVFGDPNDTNAKDWFTAYNFLQYSRDLRLIRALSPDSRNATNIAADVYYDATITPILVKNETDFNGQRGATALDGATSQTGGAGDQLSVIARFPGTRGNSISVEMAGQTAFAADVALSDPVISNEFDRATLDEDEIAILVKDDGIIVERYIVSVDPNAKDQNGQSAYCERVVNEQSDYVYILFASIDGVTLGVTAASVEHVTGGANGALTLGAGADGTGVTSSERALAWDLFTAAEDLDINFCMAGAATGSDAKYIIDNVCETRKDCIAFVSPSQSNVVGSSTPATDIVGERNTDLNVNSSYAVMDGNYKYQLDPYNSVYRWLPLNGDVAGLAARTAFNQDPWWSPAGLNRGQIKNANRLAFLPSRAQRDELYKNGVNIVTSFPGEGIVLFGDKTMLSRPSAFDRINVRQLFIVIEKAIAKAARNQLFEFNDAPTRNRFVQAVVPYLRDVQGRRGIQRQGDRDGFLVVADERVNTPEVIDANEFRATIMIKPNRSINFITLTFAATRTGVEFEELLGELFPDA